MVSARPIGQMPLCGPISGIFLGLLFSFVCVFALGPARLFLPRDVSAWLASFVAKPLVLRTWCWLQYHVLGTRSSGLASSRNFTSFPKVLVYVPISLAHRALITLRSDVMKEALDVVLADEEYVRDAAGSGGSNVEDAGKKNAFALLGAACRLGMIVEQKASKAVGSSVKVASSLQELPGRVKSVGSSSKEACSKKFSSGHGEIRRAELRRVVLRALLERNLLEPGSPPEEGPGKKNGEVTRQIFLSNHPTRLDWAFLWTLFCTAPDLLGRLKIVMKDMSKVPVFGWTCRAVNFIFLSRKSREDDLSRIARNLEAGVFSANGPSEGVSLLLFPEGTDLSASNVAKAQRFAAEKQLGVSWARVLLPKRAGVLQSVRSLVSAPGRGEERRTGGKNHRVDVFDLTLAYEGCANRPCEASVFGNGDLWRRMHILLEEAMDETEVRKLAAVHPLSNNINSPSSTSRKKKEASSPSEEKMGDSASAVKRSDTLGDALLFKSFARKERILAAFYAALGASSSEPVMSRDASGEKKSHAGQKASSTNTEEVSSQYYYCPAEEDVFPEKFSSSSDDEEAPHHHVATAFAASVLQDAPEEDSKKASQLLVLELSDADLRYPSATQLIAAGGLCVLGLLLFWLQSPVGVVPSLVVGSLAVLAVDSPHWWVDRGLAAAVLACWAVAIFLTGANRG